jgi:hypothetical protein
MNRIAQNMSIRRPARGADRLRFPVGPLSGKD